LLYGILEISIDLFGCQCAGGDERIRTADPLLAKQVLSQLSYIPWVRESRYSDTDQPIDISLRARIPDPREVLQTLRPEEWERQDKTPVCTQKLTNGAGFTPCAEPPTCIYRCSSPVFGTATLQHFRLRYLLNLRRPNHVRYCGTLT
jgi:hypothetical protein